MNNFLEDVNIKSKGLFYSFENRFPVLPLTATLYFSVKEILEINFGGLFNKFMDIDPESEYSSKNFK